MLRASTLLLFLYGMWSVGQGANDLYQGDQLELWAGGAMIAFGVVLVLGALVARGRIPGGLPVIAAGLLGLQGLDVHNAAHLGTPLWLQIGRAVVSALLLAVAYMGTGGSGAKKMTS